MLGLVGQPSLKRWFVVLFTGGVFYSLGMETTLGTNDRSVAPASGPVRSISLKASYADAAAARSATLAATISLRKRPVRSTNVNLSARQVSNSRLTA